MLFSLIRNMVNSNFPTNSDKKHQKNGEVQGNDEI